MNGFMQIPARMRIFCLFGERLFLFGRGLFFVFVAAQDGLESLVLLVGEVVIVVGVEALALVAAVGLLTSMVTALIMRRRLRL